MSITFQLPDDLEQELRRELPNLDELAKEAALVELYRQEKLTHHQLATALGLDRFETEDLFRRHNVTEDLITTTQFNAQLATLRNLVGG